MMRVWLFSCLLAVGLVSELSLGVPLDFGAAEEDGWQARPNYIPQPSERAMRLSDSHTTIFAVPDANKDMVWCRNIGSQDTSHRYLAVRFAAMNLRPDRYFIFIFTRENGGFQVINAGDLPMDGQWHTIALDLWEVIDGKAINSICMTVSTLSQAPAQLWLDYMHPMNSFPGDRADDYLEIKNGIYLIKTE